MRSLRLFAMLLLVLALLAIPASASAATFFQAGEYAADVVGSAEGEQVFTLEAGVTVKCKTTSQSGWMNQAVEKLELSVGYGDCTLAEAEVTVATEGCAYRLTAGTTSMDVVCPEGKAMKFATSVCEFTIGGQSGVKSVEYLKNEETPETTSVSAKLEKMQYTVTKDGFLCPFSGTGAKSDGKLSGSVLLEVVAFGELQTDFFLGELAQTKLCQKQEAACAAPYAVGSMVETTNTSNAVLKYVLDGKAETVTCLSSAFEGKTVAPAGAAADASITNFTFGLCSSTNHVTCSVKANNLAYRGVFISTDAAAGNGFMEMVASAIGKGPSLKVTCGGIECNYTTGAWQGPVSGGQPATLEISSPVAMKINAAQNGKCGATLSFEKTFYKFTKPESGMVAKMWVTN